MAPEPGGGPASGSQGRQGAPAQGSTCGCGCQSYRLKTESHGQIWDALPESKLELIDGRLIAGNSLAGSRYLLWAILQLLGPRAALALAPLDRWWSALASAFEAPPMLASHQASERWAAGVEHIAQVAPAGPHFSWDHHEAFSQLMVGLSLATREDDGIGLSIQRFVMRLSEDAYMPDLQCFRRDWLHHHPREWVAALLAEEQAQLSDAGRRDAWWSVARQAAALLHERFGVSRVAVIGDLLRSEPLGFWSELSLVVWDLPKKEHGIYPALDALGSEPRIELRRVEDASPRQRAALPREVVDIGSP